jgi:WD40 repeat protein
VAFLGASSRTAYIARSNGSVGVVDLRLDREVDEFYPAHMDVSRSCNAIAVSPAHPYLMACGTDLPPVCMVDARFTRREGAAFLRITTPGAMQAAGVGGMSFNQAGDKIVCSYKSGDVFAYNWATVLENSDRRGCDAGDIAGYASKDLSSQFTLCEAQRYSGRQNRLTMFKEAAFFDNDRYVVTGGDCGNVFFWDAVTARLVKRVKADNDIVNGVLTHPNVTSVVACGIDDTAKVLEYGAVDLSAASSEKESPNRHSFAAPRMRRRFAGDSDSDRDSSGEESDEPTDGDTDDGVGDDASSSTDSESMSLRTVTREVALQQLQLLGDEIPTAGGALLPHLRFVDHMVRVAASGGNIFDEDEEDDDTTSDGEEGEDGEDEEGEAVESGGDASGADTEAEEGEEGVRMSVTEATTSEPDSDEGRILSYADSDDVLGMLMFATQKYRSLLEQIRDACAKRSLIGPHETKFRLGAAAGGAASGVAFWTILKLFADILHNVLDQKFVLAREREGRGSWGEAFTEVCVIKAQIAAAENEPDKALAHLANCATQTHWSVPLLSATVAISKETGTAPALLEHRLSQLRTELAKSDCDAVFRKRAKRLVRACDEEQV